MLQSSQEQADRLRRILSSITGDLRQAEAADILSFIDAGEYGLATDSIFGAIAEDDIATNADVLSDLSSVKHLYNTFGDLDPETVATVLGHRRQQRPPPR